MLNTGEITKFDKITNSGKTYSQGLVHNMQSSWQVTITHKGKPLDLDITNKYLILYLILCRTYGKSVSVLPNNCFWRLLKSAHWYCVAKSLLLNYGLLNDELINPENCVDLRYFKIWNVILLLTYCFHSEKLYY